MTLIALLIGYESLVRLANPIAISFEQAIAVAVAGLLVNLISARFLKDDHSHHHGHAHHHDHDHEDHLESKDNNLRAAYVHVLADALTSVLAIVALLLGRSYGWLWADPLMGAVGAVVIARWSWGLIRDSGGVLLDAPAEAAAVRQEIRESLMSLGMSSKTCTFGRLGLGILPQMFQLTLSTPTPWKLTKLYWHPSMNCLMSRSKLRNFRAATRLSQKPEG